MPEHLEAALAGLRATRQQVPANPARFAVAAEKRSTLEMALDHLLEDAPALTAAPEAPIPLPAGEQAAIVAFAERAKLLTPERQQELANLLPMLTQARGAVAVQRLLGLANSFLGRR